jgi:hypothetical protein
VVADSLQGSKLFESVPNAPAEQNVKSLLLALAQVFAPSKEEGTLLVELPRFA